MMHKPRRSSFFYGWVIVAICFITITVSYGIRYSFSVFYVSILNDFGWSRADTALIFSINIIVYGITAPLMGAAIDRLGPRKLVTGGALLLALATAACSLTNQIWHFYFFFGALVSLGTCATGYVPNSTLISHWFIKKRGTAFGIFALGIGIAYVMVSVIEYLIGQIGWRNAFVVLGAVAAGIAPLIALYQRLDPIEKGLLPDGESQEKDTDQARASAVEVMVADKAWVNTEWSLQKAIKTYRFWFMFLANVLLWGVAVNLVMAHQVVFAVDEGYSRAFGALIFSLYGIFFCMGNALGFLSDRIGREAAATIGLALATLGILMLILNRGNTTPGLMYAYSVLFGSGLGIVAPSFAAAVADLFQGRHFGSINGLIVMGFGIGGSISAWLGGKIYDTMGTYVPAFLLVMGTLLLAAGCIWVAAPRRVRLVIGKAQRETVTTR